MSFLAKLQSFKANQSDVVKHHNKKRKKLSSSVNDSSGGEGGGEPDDIHSGKNKQMRSLLSDIRLQPAPPEFAWPLSESSRPKFLCVGAQKAGTTWLFEKVSLANDCLTKRDDSSPLLTKYQ